MTQEQQRDALEIVKRNLATHTDWIVLNNSIEYLANHATSDSASRDWLKPHLARLTADSQKSVAARARKAQTKLGISP